MIKLGRIRWTWHIARTGRIGIHIAFWLEKQKEKDHYEDLDVAGRMILR
jgi:hypothetical protein